jgi:large subunit ribosomal protein L23
MQRVIKYPVFTEKTTYLLENYNQYVFEVNPSATKPQISLWVEKLFLVPVIRVNTHCQSHSSRRKISRTTLKPLRKRAVVTIQEQEKIVFFPKSLFLIKSNFLWACSALNV